MQNYRGFVLNVRQESDPEYVVLHKATCGQISNNKREYGDYTMRKYRKICSTDIETLKQAAISEGRSDGSFLNTADYVSQPDFNPKNSESKV